MRALAARILPADPGCALLVRARGALALAQSWGRLGRAAAPIDAHSNFRLGSLSKQFTAMATLLLVQERRLTLETPLADLLPGLGQYGRELTVRHLLTHTSGLPDFETLLTAAENRSGACYGPERQLQDHGVLALLQRAPAATFAAGQRWAYSNSGYVLLGLIVAALAGSPLAEFLEERIFAPLKMHATVLYRRGLDTVAERAFGHAPAGGGFIESDQNATSATQGDGGIYSNLLDLARWDAGLEQHTLLAQPLLREALTPVVLTSGEPSRWPDAAGEDNLAPGQPVAYGFGWFLDPWRGHPRMWHFGTSAGFRTAIMRLPADRITVVLLCNRSDLDASTLALEVAAAYLGEG